MADHELKTWPEPFAEIVAGAKRHEVRKADRPFAVGDSLILREWQPEREWTSDGHRLMPQPGYDGYTGRRVLATVTYLTSGGTCGLPEGLCVMSIEPVSTWRDGATP